MAAEVRWHDPDKTLITIYGEKVTPDELTSTVETINKQITEAGHFIHVIVDWRQTKDYPYFADFLVSGRKLIRNPHLGWIVIVGRSNTVKLWADLFSNISNFRYRIFDTMDEVTQFLNTVIMS
jgi:hypothetical protein